MTRRTVIVGGGFTGLVAAWTLVQRQPGRPITLLEAGPAPGGLAAGFPFLGTSLEQTYHYLLLGDTAMLGLADELGLGGDMLRCRGSVGIWDGRRLHPFSTPLDLLRFSPLSLADRLRLGYAIFRIQRMRHWQPLAARTAREWLAEACGPAVMEQIWDPLLQGKFDRHRDSVSMAWMWARLHTRANSRRGLHEYLAYPKGGFARIVTALEERLRAAGVSILVNAPVERIVPGTGGGRLRAAGRDFDWEDCLFTGPSHVLAALLPDDPALAAWRARLREVTYLGAICVVLATDQPLEAPHWVNIHDPSAPFLVLINHTRLLGTGQYQGRHVYYLGCYRPHDHPAWGQDDAALSREWLGYLGRMFPGFDPGRVGEQHVFRLRNAQHVVTPRHQEIVPGFRSPVPGLYLANYTQIFPEDRGTNFAVLAGREVAELMLADARSGGGASG